MERRIIAHLDADAFFATCHELEDPTLVGKPVIVAGSGPRAIVTTASYAARKFGIGSAMPAVRARALCPHAIVIPPRRELYTSTSQAVWDLLRARMTDAGCVWAEDGERHPHLEQAGIDEAYVDLTMLEAQQPPLPWLRAVIREVHEQTGITLSAGISPTKLISKCASDLEKPAGFVVLSHAMAIERLAGRDLKIIPGIGPRSVELLAEQDIITLRDLQGVALEDLVAQFGVSRGHWLHAACRLEVQSPVVPVRPRKSLSHEHTFDFDEDDRDTLREQVQSLARRTATDAAARGFRGRTITVKIRTADWGNLTRARSLTDYTDVPQQIAEIASELFAEHDPGVPLRLLGVRLSALEHVEQAEAEAAEAADGQLRLPLEI